jgi:O-antigen/teichoic acid export membrane protein
MSTGLKKVVVSGGIYFAATLLSKSISFLLLPLYTRYLTPADYGIISLGLAFVQLMLTLTQLGLVEAANRLYFRYYRDADRLKSHLSTIFFTLLTSALLTCLVMTVFRAPLSEAVFNQPGLEAYLLVAIWVTPLAQIIELTQVVLIASERPLAFALISSGRLLLIATFSVALVVGLQLGAWGALSAQLFAAAVSAVAALLLFRRYFKPTFKRADMSEALRFGLPLLPGLMSGWLLSYIDRIFLSHYHNLSSVGLYTVGFTIGTIMSFVVSSSMPAWSPYFYKSLEEQTEIGRQRVVQGTTLLVVLFTLSAFALSLFARQIVTIMVAPEYRVAYIIVPWIVMYYALGGLNQIVVLRLLFVNKTAWLSVVQFLAMGVTIAGNFILVPLLDIVGAALAMTLSAIVALSASVLLARRYHPLPYEWAAILKTIGLAIVVFMLALAIPDLGMVLSIVSNFLLCAAFVGGLFVIRVFSPEELHLLKRLGLAALNRLRLLRGAPAR